MSYRTFEFDNEQEWLEFRRHGVTGTDISAILGIHPYKTKLDVYRDKFGLSEDIVTNERMEMGHLLEPVVIQRFMKNRTGYCLKGLAIQSKENPLLIGTYDYTYFSPADIPVLIEIKTTTEHITGVRPYDYTQLQWYMGIMGFKDGFLLYLINGNEYKEFPVSADPVLFELLEREANIFWQDHIKPEIPPAPQTAADYKFLYKGDESQFIEADEDLLQIHATLSENNREIKRLEKENEQLKEQVIKAMKDATAIYMNDKKLISYKPSKSVTLDSTRLKAEAPEIWLQFSKENTSRRLLIL